MEQPKGHPCPECGAPREPDNTPSCACGRRASEALRETRTAEAAAAEDFDPLRIRPYVELDDGTPESAGAPHGAEDGPRHPPAPDETMPLRPVGRVGPVIPETPVPPDATSSLPTPLTPSTTEPNPTDLNLFEGRPEASLPQGPGPDRAPAPPGPPRRRRNAALVAVSGALVAVVAAAGYASGLFSYETPSRDSALPDDIRASVPDPSTSPASTAPPTSAPPAPPAPAPPSPPPTADASPSPSSPSPSATSASPRPSQSAEPSPTPTTPDATGSMEAAEDQGGHRANEPLRRGDRGPEVTELQLRLRQLNLYTGEPNGDFSSEVEDSVRNYQWSRGIRDDEPGVYGEETRANLESETKEP